LNPARLLRDAAASIYTKYMASARENEPLAAGQRAPDFRLEDLNGGERVLSELLPAGSVVLAFFKVSCPTCQFTLPFLERIYRGLPAGGARMFPVSQDDADATREFLQEFGITMPTLLDSSRFGYPASNAYGLSHVPSMFLIEGDGTIAWSLVGFNRKEIEALGGKFGVNPFQPGERVPEMKSG
jgi:peroxiredoxin